LHGKLVNNIPCKKRSKMAINLTEKRYFSNYSIITYAHLAGRIFEIALFAASAIFILGVLI